MSNAQFILDNAESKPEVVREKLIALHKKGETVSDIVEFYHALNERKIKVPAHAGPVFDICGTGGSGKSRINLSTVLAINLAKNFTIAKHGNKAASGRVGSFDLIEAAGFAVGDNPESVGQQLKEKNLSFVFAPAFHPALKPLAPIRKSIPHPTIFNYLGPLLNPVPLKAQFTGVPSVEMGAKLAETAIVLNKQACFVHDTAFGLDDVSIGGATKFWLVGLGTKTVHSGAFFPEDYGVTTVSDFKDIAGGDVETNLKIAQNLLTETATKAQQAFLDINERVITEYFNNFS